MASKIFITDSFWIVISQFAKNMTNEFRNFGNQTTSYLLNFCITQRLPTPVPTSVDRNYFKLDLIMKIIELQRTTAYK